MSTVAVPDATLAGLRAIAARTGLPVADVVRLALDDFLARSS